MEKISKKDKLTETRERLKRQLRQTEARLQLIETHEKKEQRKNETRLKTMLGGVIRAKYGIEEQKDIVKHLSPKEREWVRAKFPELISPPASEQQDE